VNIASSKLGIKDILFIHSSRVVDLNLALSFTPTTHHHDSIWAIILFEVNHEAFLSHISVTNVSECCDKRHCSDLNIYFEMRNNSTPVIFKNKFTLSSWSHCTETKFKITSFIDNKHLSLDFSILQIHIFVHLDRGVSYFKFDKIVKYLLLEM